jgi:hypothetical protein
MYLTLVRESAFHQAGAAVVNSGNTAVGYLGSKTPNQLYGNPLSATAGSIALMDASGEVFVDAVVYGSQQSNSSANGTITSPEIATLEGDQSQGGCIVVTLNSDRGFRPSSTSLPYRSAGRYPDGEDSDNNCRDFMLQNTIIMLAASGAGSNNIKVSSVANISIGQKLIIGTGAKSETVEITTIGTTGATAVSTATTVGATVIPVVSVEGFSGGQTITIDNGVDLETAIVASITVARRSFGLQQNNSPGNSITVTAPLNKAHDINAQVSGSGITFTSPLTKDHDNGSQVASNLPTPGEPNQYVRKPQ